MNKRRNFNFESSYDYAENIVIDVKNETGFWNMDDNLFITTASKFTKTTLLHLYIVNSSINSHRRSIRKHGIGDQDDLEFWYNLFGEYNISIEKYSQDDNKDLEWFNRNIESFKSLFEAMSIEIFHILFYNRGFLLDFNRMIAELVRDNITQNDLINAHGKFKRANIPIWVKNAVFHRDKGRCVFCNTDLTRIFNTLTKVNYDHMVPLDLYGANDPTNIQLTCEYCNKSKSNRLSSTSTEYLPWW